MRKKVKYGYIEFIDKRKLKNDGWDDEIDPEIRKPTPARTGRNNFELCPR